MQATHARAVGSPEPGRRPSAQSARTFALILLAQLVVTFLNRQHVAEQIIFVKYLMPFAAWIRGGSPPPSTTFPLWGYPALVALTGSGVALLTAQALMGSGALWVLQRDLVVRFPRHPYVTGAVVLAALPWFALQSVRWPLALASSLNVMALIALAQAVTRRRVIGAMVAGFVLGVSLNVRSEFLLFPAGLLGLAMLLHIARRRKVLPMEIVLTFAVTAWLCIVPWALWYRHESGTARFTSSNGGFVALMSLGQLPDNPWGIEPEDAWSFAHLQERGMTSNPFSEEADALLLGEFRSAVLAHPEAYVRKMIQNVWSIFIGGFYNGEPCFSSEQDVALDILKEKLKLRVGVSPHKSEIEQYRALGQWDTLRPETATLATFAYLVAAAGVGIVFIALATLGAALALPSILGDPLLLLSGLAILYQFVAVIAAIQYEPRHVNAVYPWLALFFCLFWQRVASRTGPPRLSPGGYLPD